MLRLFPTNSSIDPCGLSISFLFSFFQNDSSDAIACRTGRFVSRLGRLPEAAIQEALCEQWPKIQLSGKQIALCILNRGECPTVVHAE